MVSRKAFTIFGDEELKYLRQVVESQSAWRGFDGGQFVAQFEDDFAKYVGRKYVLAITSGTAANEAALVGVGVGPGDEVICPPCSFIASSMSVVTLGAVPVFADVDPRTLHITAESIEAAVTPRAKAIVVVHLWGQPAQMGPILAVARKHHLAVVEDCAQAYDCTYHGKTVGTFGDVACYSLQQSKHITTGEGGIITTDDPEVYKRAFLYCNCGMPWYRYGLKTPRPKMISGILTRGHFAFGHNYRMTQMQGALAVAQLKKIVRFNKRRRDLVEILERTLAGVPKLALAHRYPDTQQNYWMYPLRTDGVTISELVKLCAGRLSAPPYNEVNYLELVFQKMEKERRTSVGYPLPKYVHYRPGICPQAEFGAKRLMPISIYPTTNENTLRRWAEGLREALINKCKNE